MSSRHAQASLEIIAQTKQYEKQLRDLGGLTEKEITRHARRYEAALVKSQTEAERAAKKAAAGTATAWQQAASVVGGLSVWGALKSAGAVLTDLATSSIEAADKISDLSADTGISAKALDGLRFAATLAREDFDALVEPLGKLQRQVLDFANGGGKAKAVFDALGVNARTMTGELRSADDVFAEVIGKLSTMEDRHLALGLAQKLAGDEGAALLRVLNGRTLDQFAEAADRAGVSVRGLGDAANQAEVQAAAFDVLWQQAGNTIADFADRASRATINASLRLAAYNDATVNGRFNAEKYAETLNRLAIAYSKVGGEITKLNTGRMPLLSEEPWYTPAFDVQANPAPAARVEQQAARARRATAALLPQQKPDEVYAPIGGALLEGITSAEVKAIRESMAEGEAQYARLLQRVDDAMKANEEYIESQKQVIDLEAEKMAAIAKAHDAQIYATSDIVNATLGAAATITDAFMGMASAVGEGFDITTKEGRLAAKQFAKTAKGLAAFDIAMKTAQAIAGGISSLSGGGPIAIALGAAAVIASVVGAMSAAVRLANTPEPSFHTGGALPAQSTGYETRSRLLPREVVVDAPRAAMHGGPEGVRRKLDGDGDTYLFAPITLDGDVIDAIVRKVERRAGRIAPAWRSLRRA